MTIPDFRVLNHEQIWTRDQLNPKATKLYVSIEDFRAVTNVLFESLIATQDALIKSTKERIAALESQLDKAEKPNKPAVEYIWLYKGPKQGEPKAMLDKPNPQFLMDRLGISYPTAMCLLDTGVAEPVNALGSNILHQLWKIELL